MFFSAVIDYLQKQLRSDQVAVRRHRKIRQTHEKHTLFPNNTSNVSHKQNFNFSFSYISNVCEYITKNMLGKISLIFLFFTYTHILLIF